MENDAGSLTAPASASSTITVHVKFAERSIPVTVPAVAAVRDLKLLLQPLTNVLPRGQKLICKGRVLSDASPLSSVQVVDGSKLMLIASQGLHQGDGPITKNATGSSNAGKKIVVDRHSQIQRSESVLNKSRPEYWKKVGVVALTDCQLKVVPVEVWDCGSAIRVLDVRNNILDSIPSQIGILKCLHKLMLDFNNIEDGGIFWEGLSAMPSLTVLSVSHNRLTVLPSCLGSFTSLRELYVANNKLQCIPVEVGNLKKLEILDARNNSISSLPSSIGDCCSLYEVDLSSNLLTQLPETLGNLRTLKALILRNNGLKSLPSTLFRMCTELSTLDLHGTEITNNVLRQAEGWEDFDMRRRAKHQKQLDFRVGSSGVFDEGADDNWNTR